MRYFILAVVGFVLVATAAVLIGLSYNNPSANQRSMQHFRLQTHDALNSECQIIWARQLGYTAEQLRQLAADQHAIGAQLALRARPELERYAKIGSDRRLVYLQYIGR